MRTTKNFVILPSFIRHWIEIEDMMPTKPNNEQAHIQIDHKWNEPKNRDEKEKQKWIKK